MRRTPLLLLALLVACADTGGRSTQTPDGGSDPSKRASTDETAKSPHEMFLVNPTVVKARTIRANFPASYRDEVVVKGLSAGWREDGALRVWEGSGEVEVRLGELILSGRSVTVTLVAGQPAPEVQIQADGDVSFGHIVKGLATQWKGKDFLLIRNDRWLAR